MEIIEVPWWDKAGRTVAVYLGVLVLLRLAGKRQLAQLNALDLVVLLLLSNVVQNAIIGPDNSIAGGLLGAAVLLAGNYVLVRLTYRSEALMRLVQGPSTTLVADGRPVDAALRRELVTEKELDAALRREGIDGVAACEEVILEPEGALTPRRKPEADLAQRLDRIEALLRERGAATR